MGHDLKQESDLEGAKHRPKPAISAAAGPGVQNRGVSRMLRQGTFGGRDVHAVPEVRRTGLGSTPGSFGAGIRRGAVSKTPISISIPTHCRPEMLTESFREVLDDERIREVAISDDCSPDGSYQTIVEKWRKHPKVVLSRNKSNVDCYRNKRQAVELSTSEWTILLDDDNIIGPDYLDALWKLPEWDPNVIYCPDFAKPHFNYTAFAGHLIDRTNVGIWMSQRKVPGSSEFKTALNTCNYFVHRESYLSVWNGSIDPLTADTMFHAYNWLESGRSIFIVPGLRYQHRIHKGSHYARNHKRTGEFAHQIERKLRELR